MLAFDSVGGVQAVVMEGDAVDDRDEEERPVRAPFGEGGVSAVVDGEEDVCCAAEIGEGGAKGGRVGGLHEHEGHAGAEEDNVCGLMLR